MAFALVDGGDRQRILLVALGQRHDGARHGGGKHERPPLGRGGVQNFFQIAGAKQYARMAVCQLDTLTYLIVSCESVLDENSSGMTLKEFEECLQEVEGKLDGYEIKLAYNIDGGGSTTMVFHNKKINSLTNPKVMGPHTIGRRVRWLGWAATALMAVTVLGMFVA